MTFIRLMITPEESIVMTPMALSDPPTYFLHVGQDCILIVDDLVLTRLRAALQIPLTAAEITEENARAARVEQAAG